MSFFGQRVFPTGVLYRSEILVRYQWMATESTQVENFGLPIWNPILLYGDKGRSWKLFSTGIGNREFPISDFRSKISFYEIRRGRRNLGLAMAAQFTAQ